MTTQQPESVPEQFNLTKHGDVNQMTQKCQTEPTFVSGAVLENNESVFTSGDYKAYFAPTISSLIVAKRTRSMAVLHLFGALTPQIKAKPDLTGLHERPTGKPTQAPMPAQLIDWRTASQACWP